ncbi:hypothetical protein J6590_096849 [Homalodisca vitripennis]|nr:hypothetical protein J6590_096849 [Homalodisca vitripennis]
MFKLKRSRKVTELKGGRRTSDVMADPEKQPEQPKAVQQKPVLGLFLRDGLLLYTCLKGLLRTPEAHHEAYQSMISAVPQTAENDLSGPPGEIHHPCPNYQRWHTAPLLLQDNQRASVQQFPPAHHTFYRADLPEGCRLCEDASSAGHVL